jgi:hypothetical protein
MTTIDKICIICGEDCAARPRVRDADGRYACRSCADQRKKARRLPKPVPIATPKAEEEPEIFELMLEDVKQPEETGEMCMGCGVRMSAGHVVCMRCGTNSQTGASAAINVQVNKPRLARATSTQVGIGAAASAVGALLGLGLWLAVGAAFDSPAFMMTAAVGLFAGIGMLIPTKGVGRPVTGLIACGVALVFSGAGLALRTPDEQPEEFYFPTYVITASGYREVQAVVENLGEDQYAVSGGIWLILGCCTAFAFGGSNPDPYADGDYA